MEKKEILLAQIVQGRKVVEPLLKEIASKIDISSSCDLFLLYLRLRWALIDYFKGKVESGFLNLPKMAAGHELKIREVSPSHLFNHHVGNTLLVFGSQVIDYCMELKVEEKKQEDFILWCENLERLMD